MDEAINEAARDVVTEVLSNYFEEGGEERMPLTRGQNNTTLKIRRSEGDYVLRIYQNHADLTWAGYELEILTRLAEQELSFAVSAPVRSRSGEIWVRTADGRLGVLFRYIDGERPDLFCLAHNRAMGGAAAELLQALAKVEMGPHPVFACYYAFDKTHPLVQLPELRAALQGPLFAGREEHAARVQREIDHIYAERVAEWTLPRQLIHADLVFSNALVVGDRVTGVLDFEFAAPDFRVMDVAVGLMVHIEEDETNWDGIEAYLAGFGDVLKLEAEEIASLPTMIAVRVLATFIFRYGRHLAGLWTQEQLYGSLDKCTNSLNWLDRNADRLVALCNRELAR
jgi:homoserine kinase type II